MLAEENRNTVRRNTHENNLHRGTVLHLPLVPGYRGPLRTVLVLDFCDHPHGPLTQFGRLLLVPS
jgi:hypothetical protein